MTCAIDGIKGLEGMCLCVSVLLSCQKGELWYCNVRNVPKSPVMPTCCSGSLALHRGHLKFRLPTRLHLNDITPTLSTVTFIYFLPKGNAPSDIPPCDFQTSWCYFITSRWMLVFLPYVDIVLISVDSWLPSSMSKSKFVPFPLCSHLCVSPPPTPFLFCCCSVSRALPGLLGFYFWHAACGCVRVIQGPDSHRSLTVTLASFHIIFLFQWQQLWQFTINSTGFQSSIFHTAATFTRAPIWRFRRAIKKPKCVEVVLHVFSEAWWLDSSADLDWRTKREAVSASLLGRRGFVRPAGSRVIGGLSNVLAANQIPSPFLAHLCAIMEKLCV